MAQEDGASPGAPSVEGGIKVDVIDKPADRPRDTDVGGIRVDRIMDAPRPDGTQSMLEDVAAGDDISVAGVDLSQRPDAAGDAISVDGVDGNQADTEGTSDQVGSSPSEPTAQRTDQDLTADTGDDNQVDQTAKGRHRDPNKGILNKVKNGASKVAAIPGKVRAWNQNRLNGRDAYSARGMGAGTEASAPSPTTTETQGPTTAEAPEQTAPSAAENPVDTTAAATDTVEPGTIRVDSVAPEATVNATQPAEADPIQVDVINNGPEAAQATSGTEAAAGTTTPDTTVDTNQPAEATPANATGAEQATESTDGAPASDFTEIRKAQIDAERATNGGTIPDSDRTTPASELDARREAAVATPEATAEAEPLTDVQKKDKAMVELGAQLAKSGVTNSEKILEIAASTDRNLSADDIKELTEGFKSKAEGSTAATAAEAGGEARDPQELVDSLLNEEPVEMDAEARGKAMGEIGGKLAALGLKDEQIRTIADALAREPLALAAMQKLLPMLSQQPGQEQNPAMKAFLNALRTTADSTTAPTSAGETEADKEASKIAKALLLIVTAVAAGGVMLVAQGSKQAARNTAA
ncbi:MAG: hypothetical protein AAB553_03365 [Patescibacteria group bacterium]